MDTILTLNDKKQTTENDIKATIKYPKTRKERDHKTNLKIELSEIKDKLKTIKKEHDETMKQIIEQYRLDKNSLSKLPLNIKNDILNKEKLKCSIDRGSNACDQTGAARPNNMSKSLLSACTSANCYSLRCATSDCIACPDNGAGCDFVHTRFPALPSICYPISSWPSLLVENTDGRRHCCSVVSTTKTSHRMHMPSPRKSLVLAPLEPNFRLPATVGACRLFFDGIPCLPVS